MSDFTIGQIILIVAWSFVAYAVGYSEGKNE